MRGSSNKTQLVLLCGLLCDSRIWQPIADLLDDVANCDIYSFAGFDDLRAMASHVLANTAGNFALAGHSMGGRVAIEVFKQAPERVSKLALLNTGVHPKRDSEVPGRQRLLDLSLSEGMEAVAAEWLPPMLSEMGRQNTALITDLKAMIVSHTPEQFNGQIQALLNRPEAESVLPQIKVPTLLLSGSEDAWSPISQHAEMQASLSHSTLVGLSDVGHMSTVEAPLQIAKAMRQWLTH